MVKVSVFHIIINKDFYVQFRVKVRTLREPTKELQNEQNLRMTSVNDKLQLNAYLFKRT